MQWLYKISVNEAINMAKKERNFYKIHQPLSDEAATDFYFLEEDKSISELDFERIINILNDDEKKIVTLKCVYELTFAQIADILKKPLPTIASKYRKALEKIEKYF